MPTASGATERPRARTPTAVRAARWILFALLLVSAGTTLFGLPELQRAVAEGRWPSAALAAPAVLLAAFAVGYAAYRIALVRAGRYPAGRALVRIALMGAVAGVVAGIVLSPPGTDLPGQGPVDLPGPLASTDPEVRALAAEVARSRPRAEALAVVGTLVDLLGDHSPEVRRQARLSLAALAGEDVGGEGPDAPARWREYWRGRAGTGSRER